MPNIFAFSLLIHQEIFKTFPPFGPSLVVGTFVTLRTLWAQT